MSKDERPTAEVDVDTTEPKPESVVIDFHTGSVLTNREIKAIAHAASSNEAPPPVDRGTVRTLKQALKMAKAGQLQAVCVLGFGPRGSGPTDFQNHVLTSSSFFDIPPILTFGVLDITRGLLHEALFADHEATTDDLHD